MSSKFPWINHVFKSWARGRSDQAKRRPFRKVESRLQVEELEVREVLNGTLGLSSGVLTLADTGAPAITVSLAANNYTVTDSNGLSGTISGWTISGTTATEADGGAGSITQLIFNTTGGTFGNATTGIAAASTAVVTINDASATIGGTAVTIDNLAGPASTVLDLPAGDTLTVNSTTSTTFAGNLTDSGSLVVTGTSSSYFALSGTNTYAGGLTITSGTVVAEGGAVGGAATSTINLQVLEHAGFGRLAGRLRHRGRPNHDHGPQLDPD